MKQNILYLHIKEILENKLACQQIVKYGRAWVGNRDISDRDIKQLQQYALKKLLTND